MTSAIQQLEEQVQRQERDILVTTLANTLSALRADPSGAAIDAYRKAQRALAEYDARQAPPPPGPPQDTRSWPNRNQVHKHLTGDLGCAISRKQFYKHVAQGKLQPRDDGAYHAPDIARYAADFLDRSPEPERHPEADLVQQLQHRLQEATVRYREARAEAQEANNRLREGRFVERSIVEHGLAARAHRLRQDMHRFMRGEAQHIVRLVHGRDEYTPDLIAHLLDAADSWMAAYSQPDVWENQT